MKSLYSIRSGFILISGIVALSDPVLANDSTAVLGAGGLELTLSEDIVMEEEKLFLSPEQVRVRYVFRNEANEDTTTRVAFPLPVISFGPAVNFDLPEFQDENFVNFSVTVDGQFIKPALEQRAILNDGTDVTAALTEAGLPVNVNLPSWDDKLRALPRDALDRLVEQGIFEQFGDTVDDVFPSWNLQATYHWEQTFPSARPVMVEHSYQPVTGFTFLVSEDGDLDRLTTEYKEQYCLEPATRSGVERLIAEASKANTQDDYWSYVFVKTVSYVLTTGANWKGPIGHFELIIDKLTPDAILSLCIDGIKKIGPTTFKVERDNFKPTEDINFVVFDLDKQQ